VLALHVDGLKSVARASDGFGDSKLSESIESLDTTYPFAVHRVWLDKPTGPERHPFVGTAGLGHIDNISCYHLFENESRQWAEGTGGSSVASI